MIPPLPFASRRLFKHETVALSLLTFTDIHLESCYLLTSHAYTAGPIDTQNEEKIYKTKTLITLGYQDFDMKLTF